MEKLFITRKRKRLTQQVFGGIWKKTYYGLYYLKHGSVVCGQLGVYVNVELVRMGRPCMRSMMTLSPPHTRPCVKHVEHGLGT